MFIYIRLYLIDSYPTHPNMAISSLQTLRLGTLLAAAAHHQVNPCTKV